MTHLFLNSQNRLFLCSWFIRLLDFYSIKINFMKPEAYAIIFGTASPVFEFMKQRNEIIKNVLYVAAHAPFDFFSPTKTFYGTRDL